MHGSPWLGGRFFRDQRLRLTLSRQVILDTLGKTKGHLSAEDIYFRIHSSYPQIEWDTIYKTLELLNRMGLVCKFDFGDRRARYELVGDGTHHHLVCTRCCRVVDYSRIS